MEEKKCIAIVSDILGKENNPVTLAAMNLARYLLKNGYDVRIICPDIEKKGHKYFYVMPTLNLGLFSSYFNSIGIRIAKADKKILQNVLNDVDLVFSMLPFYLGKAVARQAKKQTIPFISGFNTQSSSIFRHVRNNNAYIGSINDYHRLMRSYYSYADAVIFPNTFVMNSYIDVVGNLESRVISFGVNPIFTNEKLPLPAILDDGQKRIIVTYTAKLIKEKNHKAIINAVRRSKYEKNIQLVFAGNGPLENKLIALGSKLSNPPIINFFTRDDLVKLLNNTVVYIDAANIETESIGLLEAIKCNVIPLINKSIHSSSAPLILDERCGFDSKNKYDLVNKLDQILDSSTNREQIRELYAQSLNIRTHDESLADLVQYLQKFITH